MTHRSLILFGGVVGAVAVTVGVFASTTGTSSRGCDEVLASGEEAAAVATHHDGMEEARAVLVERIGDQNGRIPVLDSEGDLAGSVAASSFFRGEPMKVYDSRCRHVGYFGAGGFRSDPDPPADAE